MFFLTILLVCAHVYDCYGFFGKDWASFTTAPDHQSYVPVGESFILECSIIGFPTPVVVWSGFNSSDSFRKKSHDYDHELVNMPDTAHVVSRYEVIMPNEPLNITYRGISGNHETETFVVILIPFSKTVYTDSGDKTNPDNAIGDDADVIRNRPARIMEYFKFSFALIGKPTTLKCLNAGYPKPAVSWFGSDGVKITNGNSDYVISPNGHLWINNVVWEMLGIFRCEVENNISLDVAEMFLYPTAPSKNKD